MSRGIHQAEFFLAALALAGGGAVAAAPTPGKATALAEMPRSLALPPLGAAGSVGEKPPVLDLRGTDAKKYAPRTEPDGAFQKAVRQTQALVWASTTATPPKHLGDAVAKIVKKLQVPPAALAGRYAIPVGAVAEKQLMQQVKRDSRDLARLAAKLEDALEELQRLEDDASKQSPRWQANYLLIRGALMARIAALHDQGVALGELRKELPPHGAKDKAWRLKPFATLRELESRKRAGRAARLFTQLVADHPSTVWEQQARHAMDAPLGGRWEAVP